jgi:hypothetical protein
MDQSLPEIVFEFRSHKELWPDAFRRMTRFLRAGAKAVYIYDEVSGRVSAFFENNLPRVLKPEDELLLPDELPGKSGVLVRQLFE